MEWIADSRPEFRQPALPALHQTHGIPIQTDRHFPGVSRLGPGDCTASTLVPGRRATAHPVFRQPRPAVDPSRITAYHSPLPRADRAGCGPRLSIRAGRDGGGDPGNPGASAGTGSLSSIPEDGGTVGGGYGSYGGAGTAAREPVAHPAATGSAGWPQAIPAACHVGSYRIQTERRSAAGGSCNPAASCGDQTSCQDGGHHCTRTLVPEHTATGRQSLPAARHLAPQNAGGHLKNSGGHRLESADCPSLCLCRSSSPVP